MRETGRRWAGIVATAIAFVSSCAVGAEAPLPDESGATHVGVATCTGASCHSASQSASWTNVLQREFYIWRDHDAHSQAWADLRSERARRIAARLGIERPGRDRTCLRCHADYVPPAQRGENYAFGDGVGCEACHGGAENWLGSHSSGTATRAQNLAAGMYPTEDPGARARLCLGCHLGRVDEPLRHRLHGAGHPRLTFELDTYSEVRPAHHRVDQDYLQRKPGSYGARAWAIGQVATARRRLDILTAHPDSGSSLYPELSHFECYGCHRLRDGHGTAERVGPRTKDAALQMAAVAARVLAPELEQPLIDGIERLQQASEDSREAWIAAARSLKQPLEQLAPALEDVPSDADTARALLVELTARAAAGRWRTASQAEQATFAAATLLTALERQGGRVADPGGADAALDMMYDQADRHAAFDVAAWQRGARALQAALDQ